MTPDLDVLAADLIAAAEPFFADPAVSAVGVALSSDRATAATIGADGRTQLIKGALELADFAGILASLWLESALPAEHRRSLGRAIAKGEAVTHVLAHPGGLLLLLVEARGEVREIARRVVAESAPAALH